MSEETSAEALAGLRREIDRIDGAMHALLMERGSIIDRLIATKGTAASGSAFRPEREAAMMRVLAERHAGRLPLEAVEGIWRVIISTFTHVQAPFAVHADGSAGAAAMRDSARFHFGFTVPYREEPDAAAVIASVAASRGDLGLISLDAAGAWWRALAAPDAPKIIARLPFVEREDHPASLPLLVLATSLSGEGVGAVALYAAETGGAPVGADMLKPLGAALVACADGGALVSAPKTLDPGALAAALGATPVLVGGHPEPVRLS